MSRYCLLNLLSLTWLEQREFHTPPPPLNLPSIFKLSPWSHMLLSPVLLFVDSVADPWWKKDPDPEGQKTYGSVSATLLFDIDLFHLFPAFFLFFLQSMFNIVPVLYYKVFPFRSPQVVVNVHNAWALSKSGLSRQQQYCRPSAANPAPLGHRHLSLAIKGQCNEKRSQPAGSAWLLRRAQTVHSEGFVWCARAHGSQGERAG